MKRLTTKIEKLLLSELRLAAYIPGTGETAEHLTDERLVQAVTVNEELRNIGYTLTPSDLVLLAGSPSLPDFARHFRSLLPDVAAPPMYPDFPIQVMEMSEAQFRLHQAIHYFSTYGVEQILGTQMKRGWLPDVRSTQKTQSDDTLLKAKVLELVPEEKAPLTALARIMQKRERLTLPGRELTTEALAYIEPEDLAGLKVPFKENLTELFDAILKMESEKQRVPKVYFMLTNILEESTELIYYGQGSEQLISVAFKTQPENGAFRLHPAGGARTGITMAFAAMSLGLLLHALLSRSERPLAAAGVFRNIKMLLSVLFIAAAVVLLITLPWTAQLCGFSPLSIREWCIVGALLLIQLVVWEYPKLYVAVKIK